jgi:hypothetical protein
MCNVVTAGVLFPDFTVERYYGAAMKDCICIVIEVASKNSHNVLTGKVSQTHFWQKVKKQLTDYLLPSHRKNNNISVVLGLAFLGNWVWMA